MQKNNNSQPPGKTDPNRIIVRMVWAKTSLSDFGRGTLGSGTKLVRHALCTAVVEAGVASHIVVGV
jgi:hypothetical protein